jgi:hypothetical protein
MTVEQTLNAEIKAEIELLGSLEIGSPKYEAAVNGIVKMLGPAIELEKIGIECDEKKRQADKDETDKLIQMQEDRKDRLFKNCISVAGIVIPSVITIWGTVKSFEFEKEGTITTIMGRGFINKLLPKK